jgi:hypothetical protein
MSNKMKSINLDTLTNKIQNSNILLKVFCTLIIIILVCIAIGKYAFKNGTLTCDHYIFNTYLYIILAILLMFLIVLLNDQFGFFNFLIKWMLSGGGFMRFIIILVIQLALIIGLTYALHTIPAQNIAASNGVWLGLVVLFGLFLIPSIYIGRMFDVVGMAGIMTVLIVIITGLLGYYYGDSIVRFDWDYYLHILLVIMVVVVILGVLFFIRSADDSLKFLYVVSIIFLVIFILLLLSNHKRLKENAEKCIDTNGQAPNYPVESWGLVIKIYIVFKELINIMFPRKMRRMR